MQTPPRRPRNDVCPPAPARNTRHRVQVLPTPVFFALTDEGAKSVGAWEERLEDLEMEYLMDPLAPYTGSFLSYLIAHDHIDELLALGAKSEYLLNLP